MINPPLILMNYKSFLLSSPASVSRVLPLQYDPRWFTLGQIGVGIGMRDPVSRYGDSSCPLDIIETLCPSRVLPARQVTFHVFRPEKRTPAGKSIFPCIVRWAWQLVSCSQGSAGSCVTGVSPGKTVVNTTYTSLR
jgi:hypothetical protein